MERSWGRSHSVVLRNASFPSRPPAPSQRLLHNWEPPKSRPPVDLRQPNMLDEKTTSSSCVSLKRPVSPSSPSSVQVVGNGTNPHEGKEERSSQPKYVKTAGQAHPMLPAVHQPAPSPPPLPPPPPPPVESSRTARAKKALTEGGPQEWMAFLERTFAAARSSTLQPDIQSSLDEVRRPETFAFLYNEAKLCKTGGIPPLIRRRYVTDRLFLLFSPGCSWWP